MDPWRRHAQTLARGERSPGTAHPGSPRAVGRVAGGWWVRRSALLAVPWVRAGARVEPSVDAAGVGTVGLRRHRRGPGPCRCRRRSAPPSGRPSDRPSPSIWPSGGPPKPSPSRSNPAPAGSWSPGLVAPPWSPTAYPAPKPVAADGQRAGGRPRHDRRAGRGGAGAASRRSAAAAGLGARCRCRRRRLGRRRRGRVAAWVAEAGRERGGVCRRAERSWCVLLVGGVGVIGLDVVGAVRRGTGCSAAHRTRHAAGRSLAGRDRPWRCRRP